MQSNAIKADNLIAFIIEKAQHWVINDECTKTAKLALAVCTKGSGKSKGKKKLKGQLDITCANCHRPGHGQPDCYSKGGGKEGQGPLQRRKAKAKEPEMAVVAADNNEKELFMFTCTSDYVAVADELNLPKSKLGACIDSSTSLDYCPDQTKFTDYKAIQ